MLRDAVERIAMALRERDDSLLVFAWVIDGEPRVELDYSCRMRRDTAIEWVRWILSEKLHVDSPSAVNHVKHLPGSLR